jgi:ABC-type branched-subunit amino acid transport system substrate-binding protein
MSQPATEAPQILPPHAARRQDGAEPSQRDLPRGPIGEKTKIALLLPLSGKSASVGQAMVNAAQLAVFDLGDRNFSLMPRDTGDNPEKAVHAARDAINDGAQLLVGPLFAASVREVKPVAAGAGINMLALSSDLSLGESGVYVMGFSPPAQVERVIGYARSEGLTNFAAIIPQSPYGDMVADAFNNAAGRNGRAVASVRYPPGAQDMTSIIKPIIDAKDSVQAIFIPEGGAKLRQIVGALVGLGIDTNRIKLLGTGLWDEAGIGRNIPRLVGGWYAAPDGSGRARFNANYQKNYGGEPPRLATLAYDATAMAIALARRGDRFDSSALTSSSGFAGIDGIFRLASDGSVERGLAVNEVRADGPRVVSAAPKSFMSYTQ